MKPLIGGTPNVNRGLFSPFDQVVALLLKLIQLCFADPLSRALHRERFQQEPHLVNIIDIAGIQQDHSPAPSR